MADQDIPQAESVRHPELKPCPLCGSNDLLFEKQYGAWSIDCLECCLMLDAGYMDREAAVAAWNRRAKVAE